MEETGAPSARAGSFGGILRSMALAAGWVLMLLMGYTVLDVVLRYGFNRPFSGSLEITEFAMSVIVFLGIAYCGWLGGHVAVDILERPLEDPRLRFVPVILTLDQRAAVRGHRLAHRGRGAHLDASHQQHDAVAALSVPAHRRIRLGNVCASCCSSRPCGSSAAGAEDRNMSRGDVIGLIGIAVLLLLMALRMPIGVAMLLVGIVGFAHAQRLSMPRSRRSAPIPTNMRRSTISPSSRCSC